MKRAPRAAPAVDRDVRDRARLGQRHRFPDGPGPRLAALGGQPRLHRPEPVVRPVRRRRPARLPALRPGPGGGRRLRPRSRGRADRAREPRRARHAELREDHRVEGRARVRAHRARPHAEAGVGVHQDAGVRAGAPPPAAHHRRVPQGAPSARPRPRGLQPERLGPDARLGLLRPAGPARDASRPRSPGTRPRAASPSTTSASTTSPPASPSSATSGRPCSTRESASTSPRSRPDATTPSSQQAAEGRAGCAKRSRCEAPTKQLGLFAQPAASARRRRRRPSSSCRRKRRDGRGRGGGPGRRRSRPRTSGRCRRRRRRASSPSAPRSRAS